MFRKVCRYAKDIYLCRVNEAQNKTKDMKTLVTEIENLHTGKVEISKSYVLGVNTKEQEQSHLQTLAKQMSKMHLTTDYKLSRVYFI